MLVPDFEGLTCDAEICKKSIWPRTAPARGPKTGKVVQKCRSLSDTMITRQLFEAPLGSVDSQAPNSLARVWSVL